MQVNGASTLGTGSTTSRLFIQSMMGIGWHLTGATMQHKTLRKNSQTDFDFNVNVKPAQVLLHRSQRAALCKVTKSDQRLHVQSQKVEYRWTIAEREMQWRVLRYTLMVRSKPQHSRRRKVSSSRVIPGSHFGNFKRGKKFWWCCFFFPSSVPKVWFRKKKEKKIYKSSTCHTKRCIYKIFFFFCLFVFLMKAALVTT